VTFYSTEHSVVPLKAYQVAELGISRTFQNIRLFSSLSVRDNIRVSFVKSVKAGFFQSVLNIGKIGEEEKEFDVRTDELLEIFGLTDVGDEYARSLPYGEQRKVEIIRALATSPKLLLLDEPAAGMNPTEKSELMSLIKMIKDKFRISILLIEHDMGVVMGVCERIFVLDYGKKIAEGIPEEIKNNPKVIEAYWGRRIRMLEIRDLHVNYGAIKAIKGISIDVEEKSIVTLIGANGAGKTTLLRTISSILKPESGTVKFLGNNIAGMPPDKVVESGISQSPEGRMIFANLTVKENLEMGAYVRKDKENIEAIMNLCIHCFRESKNG
jgi:ABC-type branched-subunit amino acid transport system ATPase component